MRIRSIKPEFWRSDDIAELDVHTRLLFIGLWSYVDDHGRGRDNVQLIVSDLFPLDDPRESFANVRDGLARLLAQGLIARYEVAGRQFLHIVSWSKHQRVDKPQESRFPAPTEASSQATATPESVAIIRESVANDPEIVAPGSGSMDQGAEDQGAGTNTSPRAASEPDRFTEFWIAYPRKDDKPKAVAAWKKARKTAGQGDIIAGAVRYCADPNRDDAYTKLPATWLNAGSWTNGPLPSRNGAAARPNTATQRNNENFARLQRMFEQEANPFHQLALGAGQ